jgi:hypothetical protein
MKRPLRRQPSGCPELPREVTGSKKVVSLDYVATAPKGAAAPFYVAITAEDK